MPHIYYLTKKVVVTNQPLYFYLQRFGSIMNTDLVRSVDNDMQFLHILKERIHFFQSKNIDKLVDETYSRKLHLLRAVFVKVIRLDRKYDKEKKEVLYALRNILKSNIKLLIRIKTIPRNLKLVLLLLHYCPPLGYYYLDKRVES